MTTETKPQHTPTPYHLGGIGHPDGDNPTTSIWVPTPPGFQSGTWIAKDVQLADAEFIVRACNAHDALLAACERLLAAMKADAEIAPQMPAIIAYETNGVAIAEAIAAIRKARGQ